MNIEKRAILVIAVFLIQLGCAAAPPHHPGRVEVTGSRNLRDLGGYRTMDGKEVKKGVLYRSDYLDQITKKDFEKLAALGLKTVYDLRGKEEQEKYPQRLPEIVSVKVVSLPIFYQGLDPWVTARRIVISGDVEEGEFHQLMIDVMTSLAFTHYQLGNIERAESLYREAVSMNPEQTQSHYGIGICMNAKGRKAEAIESFRTAIRLNPEYVQAHVQLASSIKHEKRDDDIIKISLTGDF
ncbi:MAG: tyrosine-protein phosphatase, partial [Deltaproteobacteria bacterium]